MLKVQPATVALDLSDNIPTPKDFASVGSIFSSSQYPATSSPLKLALYTCKILSVDKIPFLSAEKVLVILVSFELPITAFTFVITIPAYPNFAL